MSFFPFNDIQRAIENAANTISQAVTQAGNNIRNSTMANTGYMASDLSNAKYNYDLVVGTTAQAINATMKMYLFKNAPPAQEIWYKQDANGQITPMDKIPNLDIFQITDKAQVPSQISDSDFLFAIKAGFGLPAGVSPLDVPDILELTSDSQKVNYNMFFNNFRIVTLDWHRRDFRWNNYEQTASNPYIFKYQVDMNMDEADPSSRFSKLSPETQQKLKDYNTGTMFSVQQLYLDLNNAGLQAPPTISGIADDSDVYPVLEKDFINTYWKNMAKEGKFILGYAVHAKQPTTTSSLQPTSLNFKVVPNHDANGNMTSNYKLYTLNYLMNTEKRPLTVGAAFPWNWVSDSEVGSFHGAMAVRRDVFGDYLNNALSQYLPYICIKPYSHITISNAGFSWSGRSSLSQGSGVSFSPTSSGSKILSFSYSENSNSSDKSGLISGHYNLASTASGSISVTGSEITIEMQSNLNIDFDNGDIFGVAAVKGRVGGYSSKTILQVSVDAYGKINVQPKSGYPQVNMIGEDLSSGFMSGIDGVDGLTDSLTNIYKRMGTVMTTFNKTVRDYLNSSGGQWVFPGGETFIFKDAVFSDNQDFVTHITYGDPGTT